MESRPQPAPANWIKLHAQSIQSDVFQDADLWKLWCYILLRTSRNGNRWHIGGTIIEIGRGQCAIGRKQAATDCGFSEQHTRTLLSRLEKLGNLTIKSTNKATVVTVCNWDTYQSSQPSNQPANQPAINQQSTSNQPAINHNLESKRVRETDNSTPLPPKGELPLDASETVTPSNASGQATTDPTTDPTPAPATKRRKKAVAILADPCFQSEAFTAAWSDWQQHRREIGKPVTPKTSEGLMRQFAEWGEDRAIRAIRYTICRGWQGLQEPDGQSGPNARGGRRMTELEALRAAKAPCESENPEDWKMV